MPKTLTQLEAANAGLMKFLSARPCVKCGSPIRYTSTGQCAACVKRRADARSQVIREALARGRKPHG